MAGGCPNGASASSPTLRQRRYVGLPINESNNLNEVVAVCARVGIATTALRLEMFVERRPRVARSPQPWALGRNPVGADKSHTRQNNLEIIEEILVVGLVRLDLVK